MNEYFRLDKEGVIRLLQITDHHLFSNSKETLLNVRTIDSFSAVIQQIAQSNNYFDLILSTGDLIQDNHIAGYHYFAQMIDVLKTPVIWLEGNHDVQPAMSNILAEYPHILPQKQILMGKQWQLILLSTRVHGVPYGELSCTQLEWLEKKLAEYPDRFTLIALHHNILPTHSAWLDQHSLKNTEDLATILKKHHNIKGIVHGHIHQQVDAIWQNLPIFATPSTCIQFTPNCDQFTLDPQPQGWREIYLHENGEIETIVKRLDTNEFLPNFDAKGY